MWSRGRDEAVSRHWADKYHGMRSCYAKVSLLNFLVRKEECLHFIMITLSDRAGCDALTYKGGLCNHHHVSSFRAIISLQRLPNMSLQNSS